MFSPTSTFKMLGASWGVLKKDPETILFFFVSTACKLGLIYWAYKNMIILYPDGFESFRQDIQGDRHIFYMATGAFLFSYHFINQFFSAAIVGSAARRLSGKNPNLLTGLADSLFRLPSLVIWTIIYACLITFTGLFKRKGKIQKFIGASIQAAFHVITFFVLPLIMIENANPFSAMSRSAQLLGKTWGQQLVANISLIAFRFLVSLPGIGVIAFSINYLTNDSSRMIGMQAGAFLLVLGAGIVQTLTEIYRTALYLYVRDQKAPQGFAANQLQDAFKATA